MKRKLDGSRFTAQIAPAIVTVRYRWVRLEGYDGLIVPTDED